MLDFSGMIIAKNFFPRISCASLETPTTPISSFSLSFLFISFSFGRLLVHIKWLDCQIFCHFHWLHELLHLCEVCRACLLSVSAIWVALSCDLGIGDWLCCHTVKWAGVNPVLLVVCPETFGFPPVPPHWHLLEQ